MHGCRRKVHWVGTRIWGDWVECFHHRPSIPNPNTEIYSNGKTRVGADGRNRTLLAPFGSVTSRNQPSTTKGIFGLATWLRSLMKPPPGQALVYLDWEQQEFGIAA